MSYELWAMSFSRMRFAHIIFYAGEAGEAPQAPIKTRIVAKGDTS